MAGENGLAQRRLSLYQALARAPWAHDFYQVLRRVEALHPELPRLGEAGRPADEPVRLGQQADLAFAPTNLSEVRLGRSGRPRLGVRFLGLWGPQGPLPTHLTEFARERQLNHGDPTLVRFADVFHHRLLMLFYRAWRQAQPAASRDHPARDRFGVYVGALFGQGAPAWFARTEIADESKRHFAAHLARSVRNPEGLEDILASYFGVPVRVECFALRWMELPASQRSMLGARDGAATLGAGAVLGRRVLDAQHHFAVHLGPMALADYERLLPGGGWHRRLIEWVREYASEEYGVHATASVNAREVPRAVLGGGVRLGWTTWLGHWRGDAAAPGVRLALSRPAR